MVEMTSKNLIWVMAGVLLVCICVSSASAYHGRTIEQGSTVYIGEEGLNVTHALNTAQGSPPDGMPPNTIIAWWASAASRFTDAPDQARDLSTSYANFSVTPDFYPGEWYVISALGSPVFNVSESTPVTSCQVISTPGYYILQNDVLNSGVLYCIDIQSSDVTFDGNGKTIDGTSAANSRGIRVDTGSALHNIVLKNAKLTQWDVGIFRLAI